MSADNNEITYKVDNAPEHHSSHLTAANLGLTALAGVGGFLYEKFISDTPLVPNFVLPAMIGGIAVGILHLGFNLWQRNRNNIVNTREIDFIGLLVPYMLSNVSGIFVTMIGSNIGFDNRVHLLGGISFSNLSELFFGIIIASGFMHYFDRRNNRRY